MTLALEHSFFSGRSLWQMILGGVFERFPDLRVAFVETEADWIAPAIRKLDRRLQWGDDWTGWAKRTAASTGLHCVAPATTGRTTAAPASRRSRSSRSRWRSWPGPSADYDDFAIGCDNAMFGVDYPHFESIFPGTAAHVTDLVAHPSITAEVSRKILCENAAACTGSTSNACNPRSSGSATTSTSLHRSHSLPTREATVRVDVPALHLVTCRGGAPESSFWEQRHGRCARRVPCGAPA